MKTPLSIGSVLLILILPPVQADELTWQRAEGRILLRQGAGPLMTFVWRDPRIPRPYLTDWHTADGYRLTRPCPPVEGIDATDHETMHPGIWLSFSGLSGQDFWRNKKETQCAGPVEGPTRSDNGSVRWVFENRYALPSATMREVCRLTVTPVRQGAWICWDSVFTSDGPARFEDLEEMGLGIRVATPLTVVKGGTMRNSAGEINEKGVWGKQADWLDYSRQEANRVHGLFLVTHSANPRRSYFHARDYGMVAANPFGTKSFTGSGDGTYLLEPGQELHLRFGVLGYGIDPKEMDIDRSAWAREYHALAESIAR
jgi:hypothetical protein